MDALCQVSRGAGVRGESLCGYEVEQARWGGGNDPLATGDFFAPHDIWVDSAGSVYVGEVSWSAGGNRGLVPKDFPSLQKFTRLRAQE